MTASCCQILGFWDPSPPQNSQWPSMGMYISWNCTLACSSGIFVGQGLDNNYFSCVYSSHLGVTKCPLSFSTHFKPPLFFKSMMVVTALGLHCRLLPDQHQTSPKTTSNIKSLGLFLLSIPFRSAYFSGSGVGVYFRTKVCISRIFGA